MQQSTAGNAQSSTSTITQQAGLGTMLLAGACPIQRASLSELLGEAGYTCLQAADGPATLAQLATAPVDGLVLDVALSAPSAESLLARLAVEYPGLPTIVVGEPADGPRLALCLEQGATDYFCGPLSPALLRARVAATLERARLVRQVQIDDVDRQRYTQALKSSEKYERDVQIGRQIQASFLPEQLPQPEGWQIAARFEPAREVAGDWYDAFPLTHGRVGLVIADVCDKGVGAALFMALMRSLVRAYAQQHSAMRWFDAIGGEAGAARPSGNDRRRALPSVGTTSLKNAIELTNNYIANTHGGTGMFATMFVGVLDTVSGRLTYANGGHEAPVIIGADRQIKNRLRATGLPVGVMPNIEYEIEQIELAPGDLLLAYTDGVTEARNPARAFFTEERLLELIGEPMASADALLDHILAQLTAHIAEADQFDDITMLSLRRLPASQ